MTGSLLVSIVNYIEIKISQFGEKLKTNKTQIKTFKSKHLKCTKQIKNFSFWLSLSRFSCYRWNNYFDVSNTFYSYLIGFAVCPVLANFHGHTAQKMRFFIKDFFRKCDQIRRKLRIWSNVLKKFLMENFIFLQCHD